MKTSHSVSENKVSCMLCFVSDHKRLQEAFLIPLKLSFSLTVSQNNKNVIFSKTCWKQELSKSGTISGKTVYAVSIML